MSCSPNVYMRTASPHCLLSYHTEAYCVKTTVTRICLCSASTNGSPWRDVQVDAEWASTATVAIQRKFECKSCCEICSSRYGSVLFEPQQEDYYFPIYSSWPRLGFVSS